MRELVVAGIAVDQESGGPVLLLRAQEEKDRFVPLRIGEAEAVSIMIGLRGDATPRPLTHDLLMHVLSALEASLEGVSLDRLEEGICYASLHIRRASGDTVQVDARPSDSVALAIRTGSPIFITEEVYEALVQELPGF
ncbi:MAG: bifunctional nuclease family protein [Candidatus Bipolaricaulota bacterium]|nr:bifunctional nuclease family protein [Candidatus Bipolaricaulota bacterium]MDW8127247.1 bifunctional nuclease family protein [Candidatus Bipolaricaulota bacterium]